METTRHCHLVVSYDYVAFHDLSVGLFTIIIRLPPPSIEHLRCVQHQLSTARR
jgi:hypothetical protein